MSWYVTSQSFLFAAFAISGSAGHRFSWLSRLLRSRQEESQLEHFNRKAWIHELGLAPPLLMPWLFLFACGLTTSSQCLWLLPAWSR